MNVTCPNCATVYRVDPAKVPEAGVRARCAVCSAVFAVSREQRPTAAGQVSSPPVGITSSASGSSEPPPAPTAASVFPPAPVPPASAPPASAPPAAAPTSAPAGPPRPLAPPAAPRPVAPPAAAPAGGFAPRPAAPSQGARASAPPPPAMPPAPAAASPAAAPPPAAVPAPPPRPAATGPGGRPTNPFLSQDPTAKARRLARALVSDIVVYHPAKRQEGIRDGTLKELFQEEIKKSWEEYTEQVGREIAESTGYFREALNEILAGGRQVF